MIDREIIRSLRTILARLYPNSQSAERVAFDAGIETTRLGFSGSAVDVWQGILAEADKSNKMGEILKVAEGEYADNPELHTASTNYRRFIERVESGARVIPSVIVENRGSVLNMNLRREVTEVSVCKSEPDVLYAVIGGTLFVSRDSARTWEPISHNAGRLAADPQDPATVYAILGNGLHVSNDFGDSWRVISDIPNFDAFTSRQLEVSSLNTNFLLFANHKGIFISSDRGRTWQQHFAEMPNHGAAPWYFAIDPWQEGRVVVAHYETDLYVTNNYGFSWCKLNPPPTGDVLHPGLFRPLLFDPETSSIWYADLGTYGIEHHGQYPRGLFLTADMGKTWQSVSDNEVLEKISYIDHLEFVQSTSRLTLYAASAHGIYYTHDRGEHWHRMYIHSHGLPSGVDSKVPGTLDYLSIMDAQTNDDRIYMKSTRGLLKSVDNGCTWFY